MANSNPYIYNTAVEDFKRARKKAAMQQVMARLRGKPTDLLAYEDVCALLDSTETIHHGVQEIPLEAIVGSVGRYKDFTRDFLPKHDSDEERWVGVKTAVMDMSGMPPIDVYKVGDVYFVIDGNHRVSIAHELGTKTISATVTEVKTRVPLSPEDDPDKIICKARYAAFLDQTNLDQVAAEADLFMTFCGRFRVLLSQIEAHQALIEQETGHDILYETAVKYWYEDVYLPLVTMIQEQGILPLFPDRTETDLYVLLSQKRPELEASLGWEVAPDTAVTQLAQEKQQEQRGLASRLLHALVPAEFEEGPPPGQWRELQANRRRQILFADYLIALPGRESDWHMLDLVIMCAQRDKDRLLGLHVVDNKAQADSPEVAAIRRRFLQTCEAASLVSEFAVETGDVVDTIVKRAVWVDLVVLSLQYPPGQQPRQRLGHHFNQLIRRCPRPIMAIPTRATGAMDRLLLAYDGSPKADEALFVAAYFKLRRPLTLTIVTVVTEKTGPAALERAKTYLAEQGIEDVTFILREKPIAAAILDTAVTHNINYLIIGGFGFQPVKHMFLGSTVDKILREFHYPILICR